MVFCRWRIQEMHYYFILHPILSQQLLIWFIDTADEVRQEVLMHVYALSSEAKLIGLTGHRLVASGAHF